MTRAYVDTSAVHFGEPAAPRVACIPKSQDQLLSATLVTAELLSALAREGRPLDQADPLLRRLSLFAPDGPLRSECEEALGAGPLRGADLWHVAAALMLAGKRGRRALSFCTLDGPQAGKVSSRRTSTTAWEIRPSTPL